MNNDTKHVVAVSLIMIGMAMTPNSSIASSIRYEYRPVSCVQAANSTASTMPFYVSQQGVLFDYAGAFSDNTSWVEKLYAIDGVSTGDALLIVFDNMDALIERCDFASCDKLLSTLQYEKLKPEVMVGLLRITSPAKQNIKSWGYALEKTSELLSRAGYDVGIVLKGLHA